jgi:hypothetical protein
MTGAAMDDAGRSGGVMAKKSLMRSLGEFIGHVARAVRSDPSRTRQEVRRTTKTVERDGVVLRRTTIEEIEYPAAPEVERRDDDRDSTSERA